jgi:hypothetical protein
MENTMDNLKQQHADQLKRFKEVRGEYQTLAGGLSALNRLYGKGVDAEHKVLKPAQIALIDYIFENKAFRVFEGVDTKEFSRRLRRETVQGYTLQTPGEKTHGFYDTPEKAEEARQKLIADPSKDNFFWKNTVLATAEKTYDAKFGETLIARALFHVERKLTEAFNVSGLYTKTGRAYSIVHTPEQLYRAMGLDVKIADKKAA